VSFGKILRVALQRIIVQWFSANICNLFAYYMYPKRFSKGFHRTIAINRLLVIKCNLILLSVGLGRKYVLPIYHLTQANFY